MVVQVEVGADQAELAADDLWRAGPSAVLEVDLGGGRVRLTADVTDPALVPDRWSPTFVAVDDDAYLDAWRTWAAPVRAGRHVVLRPAWIPASSVAQGAGDLVVVLDPGRAFGSGSHESTRIAVGLLEDVVAAGDRVLDVGCGSGVLSVLAVLLGASAVTAVDVAPEAVAATGANAVANGVADRIDASTTAVAELAADPPYDVVVANIGGGVLPLLGPELARCAAPTGALVVSGVLDAQLAAVVASLGPGWEVRQRRGEAGWAGASLARVSG